MEVKEKELANDGVRYELVIYVNDDIICSRTFRIHNFIEGSMETDEFKQLIDATARAFDEDLKSKSRVYTWYYFNPKFPDETDEFSSPLAEPWEFTFKLKLNKNGEEIISKVWDGYAYPKSVRNRVDLSNRKVKVINRDGEVNVFDKETFYGESGRRFTFDQCVVRSMIMDKEDLLAKTIKNICELCSVDWDEAREVGFVTSRDSKKFIGDYTRTVKYGEKVYQLNMRDINKAVEDDWYKRTKTKTDQYFKNLF